MRLIARLAAAVLLASLATLARPAAADVKIDGVTFGEPIQGPKLTKADLKGRVTLIEYWGVNCGPCIQTMPVVVKLHEELGDYGLLVVGLHCQNATPEQVRAKASSLRVRFPVTNNGNVRGVTVEGIPHSVVFDHNGDLAFDDTPSKPGSKLEEKVRVAVGEALVASAGRESFPKEMTPIINALKKGQSPQTVLPKVLALRNAADKATAEAAKELATGMLSVAQQRLDDATAAAKDSPIEAYDAVSRLTVTMKGSPVATKAGELLTKLKTNKEVQAELKARPVLEQIVKFDADLDSAAFAAKLERGSDAFNQKFGAQVKKLIDAQAQMAKSWPDAPATKAAAAVVEKSKK